MQDQHGQWVRVVFGHGHLAYWTDLLPYEPHTNDHDRTGSALLSSTTSDIYPHFTPGLHYRTLFTAEASKPKTTANHHLICPSGLLQGRPAPSTQSQFDRIRQTGYLTRFSASFFPFRRFIATQSRTRHTILRSAARETQLSTTSSASSCKSTIRYRGRGRGSEHAFATGSAPQS